ncbi:putative glycosidase CRH2 [Dispira simplex]|nr:putative glycosidase CRH2 [Dispira simplex]
MYFVKQTRTYGALALLYTLVTLTPLQNSVWALPQAFSLPAPINATTCERKEWINFKDAAFRDSFIIDCDGTGATADANGVLVLKADKTCWWPGITYKFNDIHYGTATVELTMAPVSGWATAFIRGEQGKDEIDMEWVGPKPNAVETMLFIDGKSLAGHEKATDIKVKQPMSEVFYRYDIVFLPDRIEFKVNGVVGNSFKRSELSQYPDDAKKLKLNLWNGGEKHSVWAGKTDWSQPAIARIRYLAFTPHCDGVTPVEDNTNTTAPPVTPPQNTTYPNIGNHAPSNGNGTVSPFEPVQNVTTSTVGNLMPTSSNNNPSSDISPLPDTGDENNWKGGQYPATDAPSQSPSSQPADYQDGTSSHPQGWGTEQGNPTLSPAQQVPVTPQLLDLVRYTLQYWLSSLIQAT